MTGNFLTKDDFRHEMQHYATKEDLARMETKLIIRLWVVMAALVTLGSAIVVIAESLWGG